MGEQSLPSSVFVKHGTLKSEIACLPWMLEMTGLGAPAPYPLHLTLHTTHSITLNPEQFLSSIYSGAQMFQDRQVRFWASLSLV